MSTTTDTSSFLVTVYRTNDDGTRTDTVLRQFGPLTKTAADELVIRLATEIRGTVSNFITVEAAPGTSRTASHKPRIETRSA